MRVGIPWRQQREKTVHLADLIPNSLLSVTSPGLQAECSQEPQYFYLQNGAIFLTRLVVEFNIHNR